MRRRRASYCGHACPDDDAGRPSGSARHTRRGADEWPWRREASRGRQSPRRVPGLPGAPWPRRAPCCGRELRASLPASRRRAQGWEARHGGAALGQRRAARAAQDRAQRPHRQEETGIGLHPARPVGGERTCRHEAVDMAMGSSGLLPGRQDQRAPALPAADALPTRDEGVTGSVAQQGQQRSLGREDAGGEGVGHGQHQMARGHREARGFPVLPPADLEKGLALRAVTMATGMRGIPLEPPGGAVCGVPTARRRPAGLDRVPHLLRRGRYGMGTAGGCPREADESGDCPRWSARLAWGCRLWAVSGMRRHGMTLAWAGVGPRRAGGRTGCGAWPEAAGGSGETGWWSRAPDAPAPAGSSGRRRPLRAGASHNHGGGYGRRGRA